MLVYLSIYQLIHTHAETRIISSVPFSNSLSVSHLLIHTISIILKNLACNPVYLLAVNSWLCSFKRNFPNVMLFFKGKWQNHLIYSLCAKQPGLIFPMLLKHIGDSTNTLINKVTLQQKDLVHCVSVMITYQVLCVLVLSFI